MAKKTPGEAVVDTSTYTVEELTKAAVTAFGANPDIVKAALLEKEQKNYTKADAIRIVTAFKNKEVK